MHPPRASVPTEYDAESGTLCWELTPSADSVRFAYFAPYSQCRREELAAQLQLSGRARLETLGHSLDGRDIDLLVVGERGSRGARARRAVAREPAPPALRPGSRGARTPGTQGSQTSRGAAFGALLGSTRERAWLSGRRRGCCGA
jgi:hypothetical protein